VFSLGLAYHIIKVLTTAPAGSTKFVRAEKKG
jgi:hypothetical protein